MLIKRINSTDLVFSRLWHNSQTGIQMKHPISLEQFKKQAVL